MHLPLVRMILICFTAICLASTPAKASLDFTVTTLGTEGPVVLIIGGIQGDEPGGFSAAALLATQYTFTKGIVHVVPNLNFPSIIERSRGLYGDMNRKFATLSPQDPEYGTIQRIQSLITAPEVRLILNLHDGGGFYWPTHESPLRNPNRWGQCVIIDQEEWPGIEHGNLLEMAEQVTLDVNTLLLAPEHAFHVKNTRTATDDPEMAKSLTWFALNQDKSAFGLEVSKEFGVSHRAYYHLCMVESFLKRAGLEFERKFPLSPAGITAALGSDVYIGFVDNRVVLPLDNLRRQQAGSLPLPRGAEESITTTMPIVAVTSNSNQLTIHYGNNRITTFKADWSETDDQIHSVMVQIDNEAHEVFFGDTIFVKEHFLVERTDGYRVNAIGAPISRDESEIIISRKDFLEPYSIDKAGTTYRVEVYKENLYCGTFLARFVPSTYTVDAPTQPLMPGRKGVESELGW